MAATDSSSKGATHWKKMTVQEMQGAMEAAGSKPSCASNETLSKPETPALPQDSGAGGDSCQISAVECDELPEKGHESPSKEAPAALAPAPAKENLPNPAAAPVSTTVKALTQVQHVMEPGSDLEKRHKRAERFGVSVQLSEDEKRKARAARFGGVSSGTVGASSSGGEEEKKRKARAERFGLAPNSIIDEEAKKKARLQRFGTGIKCDSAEVQKREARAARFGLISDNSTSDENKNVDTNASGAVASV